jgi:hypothetical protein
MKINNTIISKFYQEGKIMLRTDGIWNENQELLYNTIKRLLKENSLSHKIYRLNKDCHDHYVNFIKEKDWFIYDKDRLYVENVAKVCVLFQPPVISQHGIKLVLYLNGYNSFLYAFYDRKLEIFYLYGLSKNNDRAHICYYNTHANIKYQKSLRLPEFEKFYEITGILEAMFKKGHLIKFIIDTLLFYNMEELLNINIGINYNITLKQIYEKTIT